MTRRLIKWRNILSNSYPAFLRILPILAILIIFLPPGALAFESGWDDDWGEPSAINEIFQQQYDASGAGDLENILPREQQDELNNLGITPKDPNSVIGLSFGDIMSAVWNQVAIQAAAPFRASLAVTGAVVLCALCKSVAGSVADNNISVIFTYVSALAVGAIVIHPIMELTMSSVTAIRTSAGFMLAFVPVYAGILLAAGRVASASSYQTLMFGAAQVTNQLAGWLIAPLISMFMAMSLCSAAAEGVKLEQICGMVKKAATWVLAIVMTLFTAIMSIQGAVSAPADTVTSRTAKFLTSSFVPVVGPYLSDAWGTVSSSLSLLKSSVGMYAVIAMALVLLPHIIGLLLWKLSVEFAATTADMFALDRISALLRAVGSGISLLCAVMISVAALFIVGTGIMVVVGRF